MITRRTGAVTIKAAQLLLPVSLFLSHLLYSQVIASGDSTSVSAVLASARAAFSTQAAPAQIALQGQAHSVAGSLTEDGPITLVAHSNGAYEISFQESSGTTTEQRSVQQDGPVCTWSRSDGVVHTASLHNCMLGAIWFLPDMSLFTNTTTSSPPKYSASQTTTQAGEAAIALVQQTNASGMKHADLIQRLSTFTLLFSPSGYLPMSAKYAIHPDNDANVDIPVEIVYSNYQQIDGINIPFRIQRFVNGSLAFDVTVQSASLQ